MPSYLLEIVLDNICGRRVAIEASSGREAHYFRGMCMVRRRRRRRRRAITPASMVEAAIFKVLTEIPLKLTVRQIYYQLVSKRVIPNIIQAYGRYDRILVNLRRRRPDVDARIVDRTRPLFKGEVSFWKGQKNYVEVWLEKDALSSLVKQVTSIYGCALQVTRGYPSLSVIRDLSERVPKTCRLVILYLGDFDPSGEDIFRHINKEAKKKFFNVVLEKVALKKDDIKKHGLPPIPAKRTDPRYKKFVKKHGNRAVELDALPPKILLKKIGDAILRFTDLEAQAQAHYGAFLNSRISRLVNEALHPLQNRLSNVVRTRLQEDLDKETLVATAKEALKKHLKPQLKVPDALRRRILEELMRMLASTSDGG